MVWLVSELLTDPKHFFRSFTVKELGRLMTARPAEPAVRAHEMGIYKRYFDLIATGRKTTEIRVNDSSRKKIKEGSLIRFHCQGDQILTRVTRIVRYTSFDEMFDHESVTSVNPLATRDEQLANIRQIYPPEREAPGVLAIGIELVDLPPTRQETLAVMALESPFGRHTSQSRRPRGSPVRRGVAGPGWSAAEWSG
ncbi:MAG: ASCH domain-containing protein [Pseudonocardiaceae bacterium]